MTNYDIKKDFIMYDEKDKPFDKSDFGKSDLESSLEALRYLPVEIPETQYISKPTTIDKVVDGINGQINPVPQISPSSVGQNSGKTPSTKKIIQQLLEPLFGHFDENNPYSLENIKEPVALGACVGEMCGKNIFQKAAIFVATSSGAYIIKRKYAKKTGTAIVP